MQGLAFVEVSGGELATRAESQEHLATQDVRHPVLWDESNRNHKNYGIASWPTAYVIGRNGKIIWQGNPARMQDRPDSLAEFRELLKKNLEAKH
jgi:hypothetical protein